jgi:hypothetical protein
MNEHETVLLPLAVGPVLHMLLRAGQLPHLSLYLVSCRIVNVLITTTVGDKLKDRYR